MKLLVVSNHKLTDSQVEGAYNELGIISDNIEYLPNELKEIWNDINPKFDSYETQDYIKPIANYIGNYVTDYDYVLIQGEFTATYHLVNVILQTGAIPIVATSERIVKEINNGDKVIKTTEFKHIRYRHYFI